MFGVGCFLSSPSNVFSSYLLYNQHIEGVVKRYLGILFSKYDLLLGAGVLSFNQFYGVEDETQREQQEWLTWAYITIVVFPHFTSQHFLLGCRFRWRFPQFIVNYIVRPKSRKKVREELAKNLPKARAFSTIRGRKDTLNKQLLSRQEKTQNRNAEKRITEIRLKRLAGLQVFCKSYSSKSSTTSTSAFVVMYVLLTSQWFTTSKNSVLSCLCHDS